MRQTWCSGSRDTKQVMIAPHSDEDESRFWGTPEQHGYPGHWCDPIGAANSQWQEMKPGQRVQLMLEARVI